MHASIIRVGVDGDGRLLAVDFTQAIRCGWSMDLSLPVADRAMLHADNAYLMPNARITSHRLRTNTQSATAFRGFGGPQGMVGIERVMDHVAHSLGMDPLELRRLNYYAEAPSAGGAPILKRGIGADAGEVRHLLHAHASQPGRGAGACLPGRVVH
jgi:xanthine dehydrogenase large subunit